MAPTASGQVRGADLRLASGSDAEDGADAEGGLQRARHPAHEIAPLALPEPEAADPLSLGDDDGDQAVERRAMDRVQHLGTARTVYGLDAASARRI